MMRWLCHTPTYSTVTYMKERAHTVAVEAETVPVTAGLRHRHQSGNVDVVSFLFVNLTIVLHHSNKNDIGAAFQERKTQVLGKWVPCVLSDATGNFTDKDRTTKIQGINKVDFWEMGLPALEPDRGGRGWRFGSGTCTSRSHACNLRVLLAGRESLPLRTVLYLIWATTLLLLPAWFPVKWSNSVMNLCAHLY
ncbi:hypothetical protein F5888DRAFT_1293269 [Russula emetica]|nr:hypothetical protein F5888DRAFT_1293269 [Russula emetica]